MPLKSNRGALYAISARATVIAALLINSAPAFAWGLTSSASSTTSLAGSASSRGSSESIEASSHASSDDGEHAVRDGAYRVAAVARPEGKPGMVRLTLEPLADAEAATPFRLDVPEPALGNRPLVAGDLVLAHNRPYGLEFARGPSREAFFLVVADAWQRDLETRPVVR